MLKFAVCDDNIVILNRLTKMLENIFLKNKLNAEVYYHLHHQKNCLIIQPLIF